MALQQKYDGMGRNPSSHHLETMRNHVVTIYITMGHLFFIFQKKKNMFETILCLKIFTNAWENHFFDIYKGIIIPGFLGWCRSSSIHWGPKNGTLDGQVDS